MPDVSTITARLRAGAWVAGRLNPKAAAVTLDVAESAVEEAYRAGGEDRAAEIVEALEGLDLDRYLSHDIYNAVFDVLVAARFPARDNT